MYSEEYNMQLREKLGKLSIQERRCRQEFERKLERIKKRKNLIIFKIMNQFAKTQEESDQLYNIYILNKEG